MMATMIAMTQPARITTGMNQAGAEPSLRIGLHSAVPGPQCRRSGERAGIRQFRRDEWVQQAARAARRECGRAFRAARPARDRRGAVGRRRPKGRRVGPPVPRIARQCPCRFPATRTCAPRYRASPPADASGRPRQRLQQDQRPNRPPAFRAAPRSAPQTTGRPAESAIARLAAQPCSETGEKGCHSAACAAGNIATIAGITMPGRKNRSQARTPIRR